MEKVWRNKVVSEEKAEILQIALKEEGYDFPLYFVKILLSLGVSTIEDALDFLNPNPRKHFHDPFLLLDMDIAVERIIRAIRNGEKIFGHGDYDCDGVTTTSLMQFGFEEISRQMGIPINVTVFAPNRFKEGYGLNYKRMETFAREYDLIISGDTGIRAFESARLAKEIGHADLIVTDHHEPLEGKVEEYFEAMLEKEGADASVYAHLSNEEKVALMQSKSKLPKDAIIELHGDHFIALPQALAVIDPQRLADPYPCKTLAGVAVIFKVFQAVFQKLELDPRPLYTYLDLVATGCIADLAKQIEVNPDGKLEVEVRTMSYLGIALMNVKNEEQKKPWVRAIMEAASVKGLVDSTKIGFRIGPVLNAPGRLDDPMPAVELLLEKDMQRALEIAKELRAINKERQIQTSEYKAVMQDLLEKGEEHYAHGIVVASDKFHIGIAGLVAGKLQKEFWRPTIALAPHTKEDGTVVLKGSARSIPGVHVLNVMTKVEEEIGPYIYGGHEQAAGMTLEPHRLEDFTKAFWRECAKHSPDVFIPNIEYNSEITLSEVDFEMLDMLKWLEPYGQGNKEPIFLAKNVRIKGLKPMGAEGQFARITFKEGNSYLQGVMFDDAQKVIEGYEQSLIEDKPCIVDILFKPQINEWNGNETLQLFIEDVRFLSE